MHETSHAIMIRPAHFTSLSPLPLPPLNHTPFTCLPLLPPSLPPHPSAAAAQRSDSLQSSANGYPPSGALVERSASGAPSQHRWGLGEGSAHHGDLGQGGAGGLGGGGFGSRGRTSSEALDLDSMLAAENGG